MPIPPFRSDNWLPEGHHSATWEEIEAVFGGEPDSIRREVLTVDPMAGKLLVNGKAIDATIDSGKVYYQVWYHPAHNELLGY